MARASTSPIVTPSESREMPHPVESDKAKCNCELTMLTVKTKRPMVCEKMTGPTIDITIPCATNFKKVAEHEELVLHLEAVATAKKAKISEPVLQSKRARKSA